MQAPKFQDFRRFFRASLEKIFVVPADTFDNVKGQFPIGFYIWNTSKEERFEHVIADVYDEYGNFIRTKNLWTYDDSKIINDWTLTFIDKKNESIATITGVGNDFQHQNTVCIEYAYRPWNHQYQWQITKNNLIESAIYLTVRTIIPADWLNDRDQFLYPNDGWQTDKEFQSDCLAYTLFNNNIQSAYGTNHWIPFTEYQVGARDKFCSNFMTNFMDGKIKSDGIVSEHLLFYGFDGYGSGGGGGTYKEGTKREFSPEACQVFDAGRELWKYYHKQTGNESNMNASLYDIRAHFQGRNDKGKMNNKSSNEHYNELIAGLRMALKTLARKIEPKVYEYGFLKQ